MGSCGDIPGWFISLKFALRFFLFCRVRSSSLCLLSFLVFYSVWADDFIPQLRATFKVFSSLYSSCDYFPTPAFEACVLQLKASRCYCMGLFGDISGFLFSTLSTFHSGHLHSTCIYLYPVAKLLFTVSRLTTCVLVLKCEQLQGFLIYYLHIILIADPIFGSWFFLQFMISSVLVGVFLFWRFLAPIYLSLLLFYCHSMHLSLLSMFFFPVLRLLLSVILFQTSVSYFQLFLFTLFIISLSRIIAYEFCGCF